MYQYGIKRQHWADIRDELITFEQIKPGIVWTSAGYHRDLGCVTVIEDEHDMVILLCQSPLSAREPQPHIDDVLIRDQLLNHDKGQMHVTTSAP